MNEIIDAGASAESVDGDVFERADDPPAIKTSGGDIELDARGRLALYLAVGLAAGAVFAAGLAARFAAGLAAGAAASDGGAACTAVAACRNEKSNAPAVTLRI